MCMCSECFSLAERVPDQILTNLDLFQPRVPLLPVVLVHAEGTRLPYRGPVLGRPDIRCLFRSHLGGCDIWYGRDARLGRLEVAVHH
jgi:hypothetical protein